MRLRSIVLVAPFVFALVSGCASAPPPPPEEAPKKAEPRARRDTVPEIKQDIGGMNERDVSKAFEKLMPRIEQCQDDRRKQSEKLDFLSGDVSLEVRVNEEGQVRDAFLTRSTLGDRQLEKCILDAVKKASWPKPVGGREGIAKNEFQLPMKGERDAVAWDKAKVADYVAKAKSAFKSCSSKEARSIAITAYVDSDGRVITAGASQPAGEAVTDCLVTATKGVRMPSPGGWPAKVTFTLD